MTSDFVSISIIPPLFEVSADRHKVWLISRNLMSYENPNVNINVTSEIQSCILGRLDV